MNESIMGTHVQKILFEGHLKSIFLRITQNRLFYEMKFTSFNCFMLCVIVDQTTDP